MCPHQAYTADSHHKSIFPSFCSSPRSWSPGRPAPLSAVSARSLFPTKNWKSRPSPSGWVGGSSFPHSPFKSRSQYSTEKTEKVAHLQKQTKKHDFFLWKTKIPNFPPADLQVSSVYSTVSTNKKLKKSFPPQQRTMMMRLHVNESSENRVVSWQQRRERPDDHAILNASQIPNYHNYTFKMNLTGSRRREMITPPISTQAKVKPF
jgi:hypothetical protein